VTNTKKCKESMCWTKCKTVGYRKVSGRI